MARATKEMIIKDILKLDEGLAPIFVKAGMNCFNCPHSSGETLEMAGVGHGVDVDGLIEEINLYLDAKGA